MIDALSSGTDVYSLIAAQARQTPNAPALCGDGQALTYAAMIEAVDAIAAGVAAKGLRRGDRLAVLSENRIDYTLVQIACAKLGVIVACQNWRLADAELRYCIDLVEPSLLLASARFADQAIRVAGSVPIVSVDALEGGDETEPAARPEDILLIIYTSGTTGLPKAATISHRAEIARMSATRLDLRITAEDGYIAWAPMFHMGGTEHLLTTLMSGGQGFVIDGFDADAIVDILERHPIGWLMLVPSTIEPLVAVLKARGVTPHRVRAVGCMADLVPIAEIEAVTSAVGAPYLNSFGATETGMPPLSADLLDIGKMPTSLSKRLSVLTDLRLIDGDGCQVADGEVGEAWVRGPTLFSGYWNAPEANDACFQDGWYRMGDLFRQSDSGYDFVGRSKYLIKSGGENIYPAEIERLILADTRVADAIVVRAPDPRWGEVPVAVIARTDPGLDEAEVATMLHDKLARYKRPRDVLFVELDEFPRNTSGKILREAVEQIVIERTGRRA